MTSPMTNQDGSQRDLSPERLMCLESGDKKLACAGPVEYRPVLSLVGTMPDLDSERIPRCDAHWHARLEAQEEIDKRYPPQAPDDFDPSYAGERWDEDDY